MVKVKIGNKETDVKTLSMCAKCADLFTGNLLDEKGNVVGGDYDGYVPDFMPGQHCGDYVELDIDLETGLIKNWKTPSVAALKKFLKEAKQD